jgi:hypothetical protein
MGKDVAASAAAILSSAHASIISNPLLMEISKEFLLEVEHQAETLRTDATYMRTMASTMDDLARSFEEMLKELLAFNAQQNHG